MKLALIIGYSPDKRDARPLTAGLQPFDEALTSFKKYVAAREAPAHHLELWTSSGVKKSARFQTVTEGASISPVVELPDDLKELKKDELKNHLTSAIQRIKELEATLSQLQQPAQQEPSFELDKAPVDGQEPLEGDSPLIPK
jgi:hypothetical protein